MVNSNAAFISDIDDNGFDTPVFPAAESIKILSIEDCPDETYGASIVQYQVDDKFISFIFSDILVNEILSDKNKLIDELKIKAERFQKLPLWSDLSDTLRDLILENPFDMSFVELDYADWNEEKAAEIFAESCRHNLLGVVNRDTNDCYLTVYTGAMGDVNWIGHPEYGKACLEKIIDTSQKSKLDNVIQSASTCAAEKSYEIDTSAKEHSR